MKISTEKPDCWDQLEKAFGVKWESGIIVTWKGVVHTIRGELAPDLEVHEAVHIRQQEEMSPELFLKLFIENRNFRLVVELEAYKEQIDFIRKTMQPADVERKLDWIYRCLEKNYGEMITYAEAKKLLP